MYDTLLSLVKVGSLVLPNRVFMAPLTRARCPDLIPGPLQQTYYRQRASAGLIITEGTNISETARGFAYTPGIFTDAQEEGWRRVVQAVHKAEGRICLQLWHVGRVSHTMIHADGRQPVAPSALRAENAQCFVAFADGTAGRHSTSRPRALADAEIPALIDEYRQAAVRARRAGFDLVEIHAANAYLLQQFMATGTNVRSGAYGGTVENRARLTLEVVDAVAAVMGADRVGIRISPFIELSGLTDTKPQAMAYYLAEQLNQRGIAYLHVNEPDWAGGDIHLTNTFRQGIRQRFSHGTLLFCGHYLAARANQLITDGLADAVAFGRPYIANADLVERFAQKAPLNTPDSTTFYGGGEAGYTDYPVLEH